MLLYYITPQNGTQTETLFATFFCAFVSLGLILKLMHTDGIFSSRLVLTALLIFTIRVVLGVCHYLLSIDDTYFSRTSTIYSYHYDFEWLNNAMIDISSYWRNNGFSSLPLNIVLDAKNSFLLPYFALLYYLGGNEHFLNLTVINSLHTALVAVLVIVFSASIKDKKSNNAVFMVAMLQPFGLYSSIIWRDSVGQLFLVAGAILIMQFHGKIRFLAMPVLGSIFMMFLRNIYFVIGIITTLLIIIGKTKKNNSSLLRTGATIFALALSTASLSDLVFGYYNLQNNGFSFMQEVISLPKTILIGLIGPFPWTQIFNPGIIGREYLFSFVLQAIYNITIITIVANGLITKKINWRFPNFPILFFVFSILIAGLLSYGHASYVSVATIMLIPLIPNLTTKGFLIVAFYFAAFNLMTGVVWSVLN